MHGVRPRAFESEAAAAVKQGLFASEPLSIRFVLLVIPRVVSDVVDEPDARRDHKQCRPIELDPIELVFRIVPPVPQLHLPCPLPTHLSALYSW